MSLADDLNGLVNEPVKRLQCSISIMLNAMSDDSDRAAVTHALTNDAVRASSLARVLRNHGYSVSEQSIRRHRKRDCRCPKDSDGAG